MRSCLASWLGMLGAVVVLALAMWLLYSLLSLALGVS